MPAVDSAHSFLPVSVRDPATLPCPPWTLQTPFQRLDHARRGLCALSSPPLRSWGHLLDAPAHPDPQGGDPAVGLGWETTSDQPTVYCVPGTLLWTLEPEAHNSGRF
ncbi:hypothetical protein PMIN04_008697 [Paraphaeosphaeria minitans]